VRIFVHTNSKYALAADTPSISIIGGIQSEVIRQVVKSDPEFLTTGFGARFLMVYPPAEPIRWNRNVADKAVLSSYEGLIEKILQFRKTFTPNAPGIVSLTSEADSLIYNFQNRHADESSFIPDGNIRYLKNKAGIHCARLALVLHVVGCIESNLNPLVLVTPETMQHAIDLTEWFINEAHRVYAMLAGNTKTAVSEESIIKAKISELHNQGKKATVRELQRKMSRYSKKEDGGAKALTEKLYAMVNAGHLTSQNEKGENGHEVEIFDFP